MIFFFLLFFNILNISFEIESKIWSKDEQDFVPLFKISTFLKIKNNYIKKLKDLELHNFHKENVVITYYEERNLLSFIDNNTKVSGAYGDIWMLLADYLNFTLVPLNFKDRKFGNELKNGSFDGILGSIQRNDSQIVARTGTFINSLRLLDYTLPLWEVHYNLYIKPEWEHNSFWVLNLFTIHVWCLFLFFLIILSIAGYLERKYALDSLKERSYFNLPDHIFYTVAMASSQGCVPAKLYKKSRIYLFTSIFTWIMLIAFNSNAIYHMMNKKINIPFTDLKSLIENTKYDVIAFEGSMVHRDFEIKIAKYFKYSHDAGRIFYTSSAIELYQKICFSKKQELTAFEPEDRYKAIGKFYCTLIPVETSYFKTWMVSGIRRGYRYKRSFDIGILKLAEAGLIDRAKDRWLNKKFHEIENLPFEPIGLNQVYLIHRILFLGIIASLFILLIECAVYFKNKIRKEKK